MRIERVPTRPIPRARARPSAGRHAAVIVNANTPWPNQLPIWLTPYGFLRQARKSDVTLGSATMAARVQRRHVHGSEQGESERLHRRET